MRRISTQRFVSIGLSVLAVVAFSRCQKNSDPYATFATDDEMTKNFEANRADFELLVGMAEADANVMRIAPDFTWLNNDANWPPCDIKSRVLPGTVG